MIHITIGFDIISICEWHECLHCKDKLSGSNLDDISLWLRRLDSNNLRSLAYLYLDRFGLSRMTDEALVRQLAHLFYYGKLRACEEGSGETWKPINPASGNTDSSHVKEDNVLVQLSKTSSDFTFNGQVLRIVRFDYFIGQRNNENYQIVHRKEALIILSRLMKWPFLSQQEQSALDSVADLLPETTAARLTSGLLLLRKHTGGSSTGKRSTEPPLTPSQLAAYKVLRESQNEKPQSVPRGEQQEVKSKVQQGPRDDLQLGATDEDEIHWIEIKLVDEDGVAVPNEPYLIVTPDNKEHRGITDADGWARLDGIIAGQCKVSFTNLHKTEWRSS